ncbi:MAG: VOC family protein [Bacteroidales bacterium]|nr:VOC family protein [Bacteroidales bacterium]
MDNIIKYVHTNIIARDWKRLVRFYVDVFCCEPLYPERDLSGEWINKLTKIEGARIRGMHLKLPGIKDGPTLEIFGYNIMPETENDPVINNPGFGHIAFRVTDVEETLNQLIAHGGSRYGEQVKKEIAGLGIIEVIYAKDPEGNIIEIQHWEK